tara:strand:- start:750 stop:1493 length:744 start_codon:yes stop_codon:yes gene_type:complete
MEEYKVMDFQKYTEYLTDDMIEVGKYDTYEIALEQISIIEHDLETGKNGMPKDCKLELIQFITESHHTGGNKLNEDGWIVVLHKPENQTNVTNVTSDTDGSKVGNGVDEEQEVNNALSHSEQRKNEEVREGKTKDIFPHKKGTDEGSYYPNFGRGKHPNSKKNLKPFPKGMSGNPSGKPKKIEQFKEYLDWWGNLSDYDNWGWDKYTNRQIVIKGIWERASKGNKQDLDILLSLGLLDSDKFERSND